MHFSTLVTVAFSALASAKIISVSVGEGGLKFAPADIKADVGDDIDFVFVAGNHGVATADFLTPCVPSANSTDGAFWTDFQNVMTNGVSLVFSPRPRSLPISSPVIPPVPNQLLHI